MIKIQVKQRYQTVQNLIVATIPLFPISCNRRAPTEKLGIIITNINSNAIIATNTSENDDKNKSSQKLRYWIN